MLNTLITKQQCRGNANPHSLQIRICQFSLGIIMVKVCKKDCRHLGDSRTKTTQLNLGKHQGQLVKHKGYLDRINMTREGWFQAGCELWLPGGQLCV